MDYVIKVGKNFIGIDSSGKYTEVTNINQATKGAMHKLSNVVNNSIPPSKRSKCKIVALDSIKVEPVVTKSHVSKIADKSLFDDVIDHIRKVDAANFNKEHEILAQKLSIVDREICDITHYIEFNRLSAAKGYEAYKMLQNKLLERRVIKDDFAKFQMLSEAKVSDIFDGTLEKKLSALDTKMYTPRVLKELF